MRSTPRSTSISPSQSCTAAQLRSSSSWAWTCWASRLSADRRRLASPSSARRARRRSEWAGSVREHERAAARRGAPPRGRRGDRRLAHPALAGVEDGPRRHARAEPTGGRRVDADATVRRPRCAACFCPAFLRLRARPRRAAARATRASTACSSRPSRPTSRSRAGASTRSSTPTSRASRASTARCACASAGRSSPAAARRDAALRLHARAHRRRPDVQRRRRVDRRQGLRPLPGPDLRGLRPALQAVQGRLPGRRQAVQAEEGRLAEPRRAGHQPARLAARPAQGRRGERRPARTPSTSPRPSTSRRCSTTSTACSAGPARPSQNKQVPTKLTDAQRKQIERRRALGRGRRLHRQGRQAPAPPRRRRSPSSRSGTVKGGTLRFQLQLDALNKDQRIVAPKNAKPLEELLGAATGSTGPSGSSGGATPTPTPAPSGGGRVLAVPAEGGQRRDRRAEVRRAARPVRLRIDFVDPQAAFVSSRAGSIRQRSATLGELLAHGPAVGLRRDRRGRAWRP